MATAKRKQLEEKKCSVVQGAVWNVSEDCSKEELLCSWDYSLKPADLSWKWFFFLMYFKSFQKRPASKWYDNVLETAVLKEEMLP